MPTSKTGHCLTRLGALSVICLALSVIAVMLGGRSHAGWLWDFLNGLGFAGLAGLVYLGLQGRYLSDFKVHQRLSYVLLLLISAHAAGLWLNDPLIVHYVLPGAPSYMWAGIAGFVLLLFMLLSALPGLRKAAYSSATHFRRWHQWLSYCVLIAAFWHVFGSRFYIRELPQYLSLGVLLLLPLLPSTRLAAGPHAHASPRALLLACLCAAGLISLGLNMAWP